MNVAKELDIMTPEKFQEHLTERLSRGMKHIDAIVDICEKTGLEFENVPKLLSSKMRKTIKLEATCLNMMKIKGPRRLPI